MSCDLTARHVFSTAWHFTQKPFFYLPPDTPTMAVNLLVAVWGGNKLLYDRRPIRWLRSFCIRSCKTDIDRTDTGGWADENADRSNGRWSSWSSLHRASFFFSPNCLSKHNCHVMKDKLWRSRKSGVASVRVDHLITREAAAAWASRCWFAVLFVFCRPEQRETWPLLTFAALIFVVLPMNIYEERMTADDKHVDEDDSVSPCVSTQIPQLWSFFNPLKVDVLMCYCFMRGSKVQTHRRADPTEMNLD